MTTTHNLHRDLSPGRPRSSSRPSGLDRRSERTRWRGRRGWSPETLSPSPCSWTYLSKSERSRRSRRFSAPVSGVRTGLGCANGGELSSYCAIRSPSPTKMRLWSAFSSSSIWTPMSPFEEKIWIKGDRRPALMRIEGDLMNSWGWGLRIREGERVKKERHFFIKIMYWVATVLPKHGALKYGNCCCLFFWWLFQIFLILRNRTTYRVSATGALTS
jgi:hypothetical protein